MWLRTARTAGQAAVLAILVAGCGLGSGGGSAPPPRPTPTAPPSSTGNQILGTWQATGVAKSTVGFSSDRPGARLARVWTIVSQCSAGRPCTYALTTTTSGAPVTTTLTTSGGRWLAAIDQTEPCGTARATGQATTWLVRRRLRIAIDPGGLRLRAADVASAHSARCGSARSVMEWHAVKQGAALPVVPATPTAPPAPATPAQPSPPGGATATGVRALLHEYATDIQQGQGGKICDLMTPAQRAHVDATLVAPDNCATFETSLFASTAAGAAAKAGLASWIAHIDTLPITVSGDTATAPELGRPGQQMNLVYQGGQWRIAASTPTTGG